MNQVLKKMPGMLCHMDNILVTVAYLEKHNKKLEEMLARLTAAEVMLNDKCEFAKTSVKFFGASFEFEGNSARPRKTKNHHVLPSASQHC